LQKYDNALTDYEQVVGRGTSRFYARATEKGALIAYNHAKNFPKALDLYAKMEQSATTDDKRFEAQLGAMRSAYRVGNTNIVSDMATKVANNSRATKEQQITANFYIGKIAYDKKDLERARVALQKAYQGASASEQTDEAGYLLASVRYLQRDLNEALNMCEKVSQNATSNFWAAKATILEADIYAEKGDLFNARAALEAVIENFRDNPDLLNEAKGKLEALKQKEAQKSRLDKDKPVNKNSLMEMDKDN
jgi:TolA-binding protein